MSFYIYEVICIIDFAVRGLPRERAAGPHRHPYAVDEGTQPRCPRLEEPQPAVA